MGRDPIREYGGDTKRLLLEHKELSRIAQNLVPEQAPQRRFRSGILVPKPGDSELFSILKARMAGKRVEKTWGLTPRSETSRFGMEKRPAEV